MRKLLLALLALMPVAFGYNGAEFNTELARKLEEAAYRPSRPYSISFRMARVEKNKGFMQLAEDYFLVNQKHHYWGLNDQDSNEGKANQAWTFKKSGNVQTMTSYPEERILGWAMNADGSAPGERIAGKFIQVRIRYDGEDTRISYKYAIAPEEDCFVLKGVSFDMRDFCVPDSIKMSRVRINIEEASFLDRFPVWQIALILVLMIAVGGFVWGRCRKRSRCRRIPGQ